MAKIMLIGLPKTGTWSMMAALERLGFQKQCVDDERYYADRKLDIGPGRYVADVGMRDYWWHAHQDPEMKFILSVRPLTDWLRSVCNNWPAPGLLSPVDRIKHIDLMGLWDPDKAYLTQLYRRHTEGVCEFFSRKPGRLLIHQTGRDGYQELCAFLDMQVIDAPWPHRHKTPEARKAEA